MKQQRNNLINNYKYPLTLLLCVIIVIMFASIAARTDGKYAKEAIAHKSTLQELAFAKSDYAICQSNYFFFQSNLLFHVTFTPTNEVLAIGQFRFIKVPNDYVKGATNISVVSTNK